MSDDTLAGPGVEPDEHLAGMDTDELVALLAEGTAADAAGRMTRLIAEEDALILANLMKPYEDRVAALLRALPPARAAAVVAHLGASGAKRALFGNYTRIPDAAAGAILAEAPPGVVARIVEAMAVGVDSPVEMARVLGELPGDALAAVLAEAHPAAVVRCLEELSPPGQRRLARSAGPGALDGVAAFLAAEGNTVRAVWAEGLAAAGGAASEAGAEGAGVREVVVLLEEAPLNEALLALGQLPPGTSARALRTLTAPRSATLLTGLAREAPGLAADLVDAMNKRILLRPPAPGTEPAWWLQECPAATVLAALDPTDPSAGALIAHLRPPVLAAVLDHCPPAVRAALSEIAGHGLERGGLGFSLDVLGVGRGRRRTRRLDGGLRRVRIEEELDTGGSVKPVIIDLLEVDTTRHRLEAHMAVDDHTALPVGEAAVIFEEHRRSDTRPGSDSFRRLGLAQLSRVVASSGALAGINGNFYFDYGHYLNGITLGIDIAGVPGLFFGDPIGWFVFGGREMIPPAFNRGAGIVTDDGRFHIERVFMTALELDGGRVLRWERFNRPKADGGVIAYNSLFGFRTEPGPSHVDVAVARGRVWSVSAGGDQVIPLTGFVVSVPAADAPALLGGLAAGDAVGVHHNFPPGRGAVREAMACGPMLVRDGALDVAFAEEDFGQQDSTVMSFFLPRTVETYQAARSFMAVRDETLILGTVSGMAYGLGVTGASAGMTFGELAQLCVDLGVDRAYALDGGGSSSLVGRDQGEVVVLNSPTGGADVGAGDERFINTYWLVFDREESHRA